MHLNIGPDLTQRLVQLLARHHHLPLPLKHVVYRVRFVQRHHNWLLPERRGHLPGVGAAAATLPEYFQ